jgi:hypothetical protein
VLALLERPAEQRELTARERDRIAAWLDRIAERRYHYA